MTPLRVVVVSSVGGGPMARLTRFLANGGVIAHFTGERWRALTSAGRARRLAAKLRAALVFPAGAVFAAYRSSATVVATTNPFFLPAVLVATRGLHGRPVVPLVYDLYPDVLEAVGLSRPNGVLAALGASLNRWWLRRADAVVFIGARMARHTIARYGEPRHWAVFETGADASEFTWPPGRRDRRAISYVGNLGHVHDWETFAEGLPRWLASASSAGYEVVFAASGSGVETLRERCQGQPRMRFTGPLDNDAWRDLLESSAISLISLRSTAAHTSIPSKMFSAMAAGSAILAVAPRESDLADIVIRHDCGVVVAPGDSGALAAALERLTSDPAELARLQGNARQAVEQHYDTGRLADGWQSFLAEALRERMPMRGYEAAKRLLDLAVSTSALVALTPLLALVAAAIRVTMGSPVLFLQQRPGLGGRPFELLKFRTMRPPRPGEEGSAHDAGRLTRLGRWLRRTSIDELPTLWNVLRGDMSLVGPRPLLMSYLQRYTRQQARRHEVKPGITGWAQVNGRNAISWEERFALDVDYVDNRSLLWDLQILAQTAWKVLRAEGISEHGHATMSEFLGTTAKDPRDV